MKTWLMPKKFHKGMIREPTSARQHARRAATSLKPDGGIIMIACLVCWVSLLVASTGWASPELPTAKFTVLASWMAVVFTVILMVEVVGTYIVWRRDVKLERNPKDRSFGMVLDDVTPIGYWFLVVLVGVLALALAYVISSTPVS